MRMVTGRPRPVVAKAGVTRDPKRRYDNDGKVCKGKKYKCGGKLKK